MWNRKWKNKVWKNINDGWGRAMNEEAILEFIMEIVKTIGWFYIGGKLIEGFLRD